MASGVSRWCQQVAPAVACVRQQLARFAQPIADDLVARQAIELGVAGLAERETAVEVPRELVEQLELVLERQLDIDALDRVGVLAHSSAAE